MIRKALRYAFSRKLLKPNFKKDKETAKSQKTMMEYQFPFPINMDNYNYLDSLDIINLKRDDIKKTENIIIRQDIKQLFNDHDQSCLQMIRIQQEGYINNMSSSQSSQQLSQFLIIKKRLSLKFRKYDEILIDIDNYLQILKHSDIDESQLVGLYLQAYNKCVIILILSDHERLYELLSPSEKNGESLRKKRNMGQKKKSYMDALITFLKATQRCQQINKQQDNYPLYFQSAYLQFIALLSLGIIKQAFTKAYFIIQQNSNDRVREEVYLAMMTILAFQNQSNNKLVTNLLNQDLKHKICNLQPLNQQQCSKMHLYYISADIGQKILDKLSVKQYNKPIKQLQAQELTKYGRILCLLCENYYLQGKLQQAERLITIVQQIKQPHIWILLNYIKMAIFYDLKDYKSVLQIFQQILNKQTLNRLKPSPQFYDIKMINNDILRVKIYEIVVKTYKQLGETQKCQETQEQMMALTTTLSPYVLKQPQLQDLQLKQNWRTGIKVKIPYFYLQLKIGQHFGISQKYLDQNFSDNNK